MANGLIEIRDVAKGLAAKKKNKTLGKSEDIAGSVAPCGVLE